MRIQARLISLVGIMAVISVLAGCSSPALYVEKDPRYCPISCHGTHSRRGQRREEKARQKDQSYWAYDYWKEYSKADFPVDPQARYTATVSSRTTLTPKDRIWTTWKSRQAAYLFVVADIPLNVRDGRWCVTIPFQPKQWEGKTATVLMGPKGALRRDRQMTNHTPGPPVRPVWPTE